MTTVACDNRHPQQYCPSPATSVARDCNIRHPLLMSSVTSVARNYQLSAIYVDRN